MREAECERVIYGNRNDFKSDLTSLQWDRIGNNPIRWFYTRVRNR